jgi:hypothetical protein
MRGFNGRMKRLSDTLHELGPALATLYGMARLVHLCGARLFCYRFVAQPVHPRPPRPRRSAATSFFAASGLSELGAGRPRPDAILAQRFARGAQCVAATRDGQLAGFLWYQLGAYDEDEVRARYRMAGPALAWDFDVFVQPALRCGPTFGRLWEEAHRELDAAGVRWTCSRISPFNAASLRAHARLGAREIGAATFLCIGRLQLMAASLPPYFHASLSRPVELRFDPVLLPETLCERSAA